jgi:hypothetical protein
MTRLLAEAENEGEDGKDRLRKEMKTRFQQAYNDLEIPKELEKVQLLKVASRSTFLAAGLEAGDTFS